MNDTEEDLRETLQSSFAEDNYSLFVRHLDNWIKVLADRDGALGQKVVVDKVQEAIHRNAVSNEYHYKALAEKYQKDGDEALAEYNSIVASVYRSIAEE